MKLLNLEFEEQLYEIDCYKLETRKALSTHEYAVCVDHLNKVVYGDVIRYGSWENLSNEEIKEVLELVESEGELRRPYKGYL